MIVQSGVSSEKILFATGHFLFVEGKDDGFDPTVIRELLRSNNLPIKVNAIGRCDNVVEAAKAMQWKHPTYYFIADRDGRDQNFVEKSWANFMNENSFNLIFWRKRELENYFIEPTYIRKSQFVSCSEDELRNCVLQEANRRYFMEAANLVLLKIRSKIIIPPSAWFTQIEKFRNREDALHELVNSSALCERGDSTQKLLEKSNRARMLDEHLDSLSGGKNHLEYGAGEWLNQMSGKEIFKAIAGKVFRVKNASGEILQGPKQNNEVAKDLLKRTLTEQPSDFQQLVELLKRKLAKQT